MRTVRVPVGLVALGVCVVLGCGGLAGVAGARPSEHPFGIVPGSFHFVPSSLQAGAHADWLTSFAFEPEGEGGPTYNDARNVGVELPAGFDASDTAVPTCTQEQLLAINQIGDGEVPRCPLSSQVGLITLEILTVGTSPEQLTVPLYNMEVTTFGTTAELGYKTVIFAGLLQIGVRARDVGLTSSTVNIPKAGEIHKVSATVWGVPAAKEHDALRGAVCGDRGEHPAQCHYEYGGPQSANIAVRPFLSNPTSCGVSEARMEADSWEEPFNWSRASYMVGPIGGCERVPFEPSIEAQPSTRSADSPTGLEVGIVVPQTWENQFTIATANLKDARVTLPEGMTANPGLAEGLGACTPAQYASETSGSLPGEGCPAESKIGSIEIETPLLNEKIQGAIYIATPYDNIPEFGDAEHPGGSLLALYIVAKDPARGVLVKAAGKITPNPVTGQLVTTFDDNPQQPFSKFTLRFRPGATAPLISPAACGPYTVQAELTPWSAPEEPRFVSSQPFQITQGTHEGPCPTGGVPPFKPQVVSGTQNNAGSGYSPFYLRILREDGEQEITRFSTTLPPGLTGNLTGIPFCPDADIEAARDLTGLEEEEHPACPQASEIGHTIVGAGVGPVLAENPGKIYLAGPYHGAPLSVVSITAAKVGPFDLGTVVIRFALDINHTTAQVEVSGAQSEAIPHIIKGIVIHVRDIRVYMNRDKFIINPTNCNPQQITETIDGAGANFADPADQDPVTVTAPFEAADCSSLAFKPVFKVSTPGKTSKANGAGLSVKLSVPAPVGTQTNIARVKVELPKALPSRLTTLRKACVAATFEANPADCPADSIVGHATATTPIVPEPLTGPAYFVSHGGEAFPSLIIVLQGYGFTIDLVGSTFINEKTGITSSTFKAVPDVPVGTFELTLPQGPFSALAANRNLCTGKGLTMPTEFLAQNGAAIHQNTKIAVQGCAKSKHRKKARHAKVKRSKARHSTRANRRKRVA